MANHDDVRAIDYFVMVCLQASIAYVKSIASYQFSGWLRAYRINHWFYLCQCLRLSCRLVALN